LSFSGCPPSLLFEVKSPGCTKWINESLAYLEKNESIENVLLGFRYSKFLFGNQLDLYPDLPDIDPEKTFTDAFRSSMTGEPREIYWQSFEEIVSRLLKAGKNVYLLYPVPELPVDINKAITPFSTFDSRTMIDLKNSTSAEYYFKRNEFIIDKLDSLPFGRRLHAIKPFDIFCSEGYCPAVRDKNALYFDDHHLSVSGAALIAESIDLEQHGLVNKE
jgi:lysophospholipase L1-like esterase